MPREPPRPYDYRWKRVRPVILARDGYRCYVRGCTTPATTVDHIVPISEAPHLRLEPANLRASCSRHNSGRANSRTAQMARINRMAGAVRDW